MPSKASDRAKPDLKKDQAFMVNPKAVEWIISQAGLRKTDTVLEIGAGTGNLTRALAVSGARVIAVEKDISFEKELRENLREFPAVEIVIGNALNLLDARGFRFDKLISNIPYAISEPLMQRLIFHDFEMAVLTLPKSFAARLIAAEWEKEYSRLSFVFQKFFIVQACLDLQRDVFRPIPKTHSVVLKFVSKPKNTVTCQMLLRPDMAAKNALREALCSAKGYTKNMARQTIKSLNLNNLMEKSVSELGADDIKGIVKKTAEFRED
ncbi:MAG: methyltransferase domain-containing protein [Candidatus Aenigmarchaeota archaeon]|nr:methyltransferase domain-containing protein [Candidatus Aenigmarchaeota archaeon]